MKNIISERAIKRRTYWVEEIRKLSGNFVNDTDKLEKELEAEISKSGVTALIDHLRLCGCKNRTLKKACVLKFTFETTSSVFGCHCEALRSNLRISISQCKLILSCFAIVFFIAVGNAKHIHAAV